MMETIYLYQIDCRPTYWEGYSDSEWLVSLYDDEVGDYISNNKDKDILVYPLETYLAMFDIHIQLDKWWGTDDYHVDDCEVLHNHRLPFDDLCEGCKMFESWASKRVYGDYNKKVMKNV